MNEDDVLFPKISTLFDSDVDDDQKASYQESVRKILKKILPSHIFRQVKDNPDADQKFKTDFMELFPSVTSTSFTEDSSTMSFYVLAKYRPNAFKFFFEMVSQWLVPGKRLNMLLLYAADFRLSGLGSTVYTVCELMIEVRSREEFRQIKRNLPMWETELRLGMESGYYAAHPGDQGFICR